MIKLKSILLICISLLIFSCDEKEIEITNHKIADLEYTFPLPKDYEQISSNDVVDILRTKNITVENSLAHDMNTKQTHFSIKSDIDNLVTITNAVPRLEIERGFLNEFAQMIEEKTFNNLDKKSNHRLIEKNLLEVRNNKALKVKYDYDGKKQKQYFTLYLITTKKQSFVVTNYSNNKSDLQNMISKYLNKI